MTKGKLLFRIDDCHAVMTSISWYKGASQAASVEQACSITHCTPFLLYHFVSSTSI